MIIRSLLMAAGFTAGNFYWQLFTEKDWDRAFERSWFQSFALVGFGLYMAYFS